MAVIKLNTATFTQVAVTGKVLVQFQGGVASVSAVATPPAGDTVNFASGDMFVAERAFYARGIGQVVTMAINATTP